MLILNTVLLFSIANIATEISIPFDCAIEPNQHVAISSAVSGVIDTIHVKRGDIVKKNQLLIELESSVEKSIVDISRLRSNMDTLIASRKLNWEYESRKLNRNDKLFKNELLSPDEYDELKTKATLANNDYKEAIHTKKLAELELKKSKEELKLRIIRSPINGIVTNLFFNEGEYVSSDPVLELAQIDPLKVKIFLPLKYFGMLTIGDTATVIPELDVKGDFKGTVRMIDKVIDAASGIFEVHLELPNSDFELPSGINCKIEFSDQL